MTASLFLVIVTFNGERYLEQCLRSIYLSSIRPKLIVIDNNSQDRTLSILQSFEGITIFRQKQNIGFGKANNIGIQAALSAGAKSIFLLNQDAYLAPDCLEKTLLASTNNLEYGIFSPIHLNGSMNAFDASFLQYLKQSGIDNLSYTTWNSGLKTIYPVSFVNAAAWLITEECLRKVGGFDPIFFQYGEDLQYCSRAQFAGLKIGILNSTYIAHDREDREGKMNKSFLERNQLIYSIYQTTNPLIAHPMRTLLFCCISMAKQALREAVLIRPRKSINKIRDCISLIFKSKEILSRKRLWGTEYLWISKL